MRLKNNHYGKKNSALKQLILALVFLTAFFVFSLCSAAESLPEDSGTAETHDNDYVPGQDIISNYYEVNYEYSETEDGASVIIKEGVARLQEKEGVSVTLDGGLANVVSNEYSGEISIGENGGMILAKNGQFQLNSGIVRVIDGVVSLEHASVEEATVRTGGTDAVISGEDISLLVRDEGVILVSSSEMFINDIKVIPDKETYVSFMVSHTGEIEFDTEGSWVILEHPDLPEFAGLYNGFVYTGPEMIILYPSDGAGNSGFKKTDLSFTASKPVCIGKECSSAKIKGERLSSIYIDDEKSSITIEARDNNFIDVLLNDDKYETIIVPAIYDKSKIFLTMYKYEEDATIKEAGFLFKESSPISWGSLNDISSKIVHVFIDNQDASPWMFQSGSFEESFPVGSTSDFSLFSLFGGVSSKELFMHIIEKTEEIPGRDGIRMMWEFDEKEFHDKLMSKMSEFELDGENIDNRNDLFYFRAAIKSSEDPEFVKKLLEISGIKEEFDPGWDHEDMARIYSDQNFLEITEGLNPVNRWSVAVAASRLIAEQGDEITESSLDSAARKIMQFHGEDFANKPLIDKETTVIPISYKVQDIFSFPQVVDFAADAGAVVIDDSSPDKDTIESKNLFLGNIEKSSGKTVVWFSAHGHNEKISLGDDVSISYKELAYSLMKREGTMDDVTVIMDSCFGYDFKRNLYDYIGEFEKETGQIFGKPNVITVANRAQYGYASPTTEGYRSFFLRGIAQERGEGEPLTYGDLLKAEQHFFELQDMSITLGSIPETYGSLSGSYYEGSQIKNYFYMTPLEIAELDDWAWA